MPKVAAVLTDRQVKAIKAPGFYPVGGVKGLGLKISSGDSRSWILRATTGELRTATSGKIYTVRRDHGLGGFPDVSLAEARKRAIDLRQQLRDGIDPVAEKKALRAAQVADRAKLRTFEDVAKECHTVRQSEFKNSKHAAQWINTLTTYAFPILGKLPVGAIDTTHLVEVLQPIWLTKHETASRVRQRIASVLDYATAMELRTGPNPADLQGKLRELLPRSKAVRKKAGKRHHARVPVEQMSSFMTDLRTKKSISAKALEFAILTAGRSGEVRGATWEEIDLERRVWRLSPERMKADKGHTVPLSDAAMSLLEALPKYRGQSLVFTNSKNAALSDAAMGKLIKDMHTTAVEAGGKGYLDPDQGRIATPHGTARSSFKDWSLKSTARVMANGNTSSFPDELSELALAHVNSDETRAAYARGGLLEERQELMQAWANYLGQKMAGNVLKMGTS
ncbi:Phage integrase family protein [Halopseudomonas sabulinigri]|uniref:Phage integrase family protein n=1 Tax=Halopseudomonas sabulinigri TaxID=472181 RepID=A0A1H1M1R0_9GAMM|nr:integrase arm-type DNA-binding domain-containing protein [Halopseudomonas sabulinigri]SDR80798.1 Phage integrase family protein [Halopseudomonas sabulinigri]